MEQRLIEIAKELAKLEDQPHNRSTMEKMTSIADSLSFEELMQIDEYILENRLLTK